MWPICIPLYILRSLPSFFDIPLAANAKYLIKNLLLLQDLQFFLRTHSTDIWNQPNKNIVSEIVQTIISSAIYELDAWFASNIIRKKLKFLCIDEMKRKTIRWHQWGNNANVCELKSRYIANMLKQKPRPRTIARVKSCATCPFSDVLILWYLNKSMF